MKLFGLMAVTVAMIGAASADTITATCGSFTTIGASGSWTCPSFSSLVGAGTINSAYLVYNSDYSSGLTSSVTEVTAFTFGGTNITFGSDTITTTGGSSSTSFTSSQGSSDNGLVTGPPLILAGFYNNLSSPYTGPLVVGYTNSITSGQVLTTSGYAELVVNYTASAVPEPGSMMLMGSGLVAFALIGRKLVRK